MKTYIYTKEGKWSRTYGNSKLTFSVYQVKKNKPVFIGQAYANSASYRGDESTVMNYLIEQKLIAKKNYGYYHNAKGDFRILSV